MSTLPAEIPEFVKAGVKCSMEGGCTATHTWESKNIFSSIFFSLLGTPGHCSWGHHTAAPGCPLLLSNNLGLLPGMVRVGPGTKEIPERSIPGMPRSSPGSHVHSSVPSTRSCSISPIPAALQGQWRCPKEHFPITSPGNSKALPRPGNPRRGHRR